MRPRLLADENIPWPLVRLLRKMGADVAWLPETDARGVSDERVIILANELRRTVLTRDEDFIRPHLWKRASYGMIYVGEPVTKKNVKDLASNVVKVLESVSSAPFLAVITSGRVEVYKPK